jgi:branched-chain amino acid transport system permease protein
MLVSVSMLAAIWLALTKTRIGLVIQAALSHPQTVEALGHNVPRVFMLVFGGGAALAGLAGVIGGNAFVTEPGMAALVGPIVFVIVVVGGMGSLVSQLGWTVIPQTPLAAIWNVKLSQAAPVLPYLLMVLLLIFRPKGLMGTREG